MTTPMKTIDLEIARSISASPEEAFDAWLDPACPGTTWHAAAKLILHPKVDGLFYWLYVNPSGGSTPHYGRFTIVDRPARIQYTWVSPHTRGLESLVSVTFRPQGQDTLMTLRHEHLPDDEDGRRHEQGWGYFVGAFAARYQGRHPRRA